VDRRRPISGDLEQDACGDNKGRAGRKKHRDDIERDLGVIREIAEIGADRCREICRSELAITRTSCFKDLSALPSHFFRALEFPKPRSEAPPGGLESLP
jgi:hypothetical protein